MNQISLDIKTPDKHYTIFIGAGLLSDAGRLANADNYSRICILTDENVAPHWLGKLRAALKKDALEIVIPAGEKEKNIESVIAIWQKLSESGFDRKSLLINLGGGVVGDIGGFAASTYMRGIAYAQIPTTLLAQVDASVGGKTGVDFANLKNIIGSFYQPDAVIIDVDTLLTLPLCEFVSGFGEIIKHGLIADADYFSFVTTKKPKEFSLDELEKIIETSCALKARIASQDEREGKLRKLLNFGHTVGHAIEAIALETPAPLLHGEAVSIGMVAESRISAAMGLLSKEDAARIESVLKNAGLPIRTQGVSKKEIITRIAGDKKSEKGRVRWTLLSSIGNAVVDQEVPDEILSEAVGSILI